MHISPNTYVECHQRSCQLRYLAYKVPSMPCWTSLYFLPLHMPRIEVGRHCQTWFVCYLQYANNNTHERQVDIPLQVLVQCLSHNLTWISDLLIVYLAKQYIIAQRTKSTNTHLQLEPMLRPMVHHYCLHQSHRLLLIASGILILYAYHQQQ